jgi:putative oxygen-independent coproporphyrinogen III oxidase
VSARHLYVHIPFCRSRCAYCDFASEPIAPHARAGRVGTYVERLRQELAERSAIEAGAEPFETVYLGGGTPTVLPEDLLVRLVSDLAHLQEGVADREFTVEANPGTLTADLLRRLGDAGITRVSLGIQSFSPRSREALGRHTKQAEVEEAPRLLAGAEDSWGLQWNLDLVFGIPGQDWAEASTDIDRAIGAGPHHISLYDLTYTPGFAARVTRTAGAGALDAAGAFAERYLPSAAARLEAAGYERYEVSNFARPGHECRHNQAYWHGEDYLGVGAAAVSTIGQERRTNPSSVDGYVAGHSPALESLTRRLRLWEKAMLGLRTTAGVDEAEVLPVLDIGARERLLEQDCLHRCCGRLRLNPAFLDVSNTVISTLLAASEES